MRSIFRPPASWRHRSFRYRMMVWRCVDCGAVHNYRARRCRRCRSGRIGEDQLPQRGRLLFYTMVRTMFEGYEHHSPSPAGIIEFEDGTRILALLTDCEPEELREGMVVERVFRKIAEDGDSGVIVYGFKFRPLLTQGK